MQKDLGDIFDDLAKRMVGSITDEDIKKLNAYQRTVSAAIATDKAQLLKGQPTMNVGVLVQVLDVLREQQDRKTRLLLGSGAKSTDYLRPRRLSRHSAVLMEQASGSAANGTPIARSDSVPQMRG